MATQPTAIAAAHRGMAVRPDVTALLPTVRVPALIIVGEHDVISPPAEMKSIADSIPDSQYAVVPQAGHMAPLENPLVVNRLIREFLKRDGA